MNVSGLAGFLLAKTAAAYSRRKPKDWYLDGANLRADAVTAIGEFHRLITTT